jgi:VIT1/CCC1 family predicted Fe2+/Mn2+ transporter
VSGQDQLLHSVEESNREEPNDKEPKREGVRKRYIGRYLAPAESLAEIIFGLIMVLGFTSTARLALGEISSQRLLLAVIGCNLAWGIVDGVMYILGSVYERGQRARIAQAMRQAPDEQTALTMVAEELDQTLAPLMTKEQRTQVYRWVIARVQGATLRPVRITPEDLSGALASGLLVFLSVMPVALPFVFFKDSQVALRTSNLLCVVMLFVVGYIWAQQTSMNRFVAGLLLMLLGLSMVVITVLLGG